MRESLSIGGIFYSKISPEEFFTSLVEDLFHELEKNCLIHNQQSICISGSQKLARPFAHEGLRSCAVVSTSVISLITRDKRDKNQGSTQGVGVNMFTTIDLPLETMSALWDFYSLYLEVCLWYCHHHCGTTNVCSNSYVTMIIATMLIMVRCWFSLGLAFGVTLVCLDRVWSWFKVR